MYGYLGDNAPQGISQHQDTPGGISDIVMIDSLDDAVCYVNMAANPSACIHPNARAQPQGRPAAVGAHRLCHL